MNSLFIIAPYKYEGIWGDNIPAWRVTAFVTDPQIGSNNLALFRIINRDIRRLG
jgi:hypothetical protein